MAECENCGYDTTLAEYVAHDVHNRKRTYRLCEICASTRLGMAAPARSDLLTQGEVWLMRSLAYIANMLRDEIRGFREEGDLGL